MNKDEFIKMANQARKQNKNKWCFLTTTITGQGTSGNGREIEVTLKNFNTWLQVYTVNGIDHSNCSDKPVKRYLEDLNKPFL